MPSPDLKPLLRLSNIKKHYPVKNFLGQLKGSIRAVDGVSFELYEGETLALVGESGCGKSTLSRVILGLESPTEGSVLFSGTSVDSLTQEERVKQIQMIFQDPYSSLNPRKRVWELISEPLRIQNGLSAKDAREAALELMKKVGIRSEMVDRYPHMFSGGQRQRIGIARALALQPKILLCDEPVSALDVSIQAQVLNLFKELKESLRLTFFFVSHDLDVVRHVADRVAVMYLGKIVEMGTVKQIFENPTHPYTRALLGSSPDATTNERESRKKNGEEVELEGDLPSPLNPPSGCALHTRCPFSKAECKVETPQLRSFAGRESACLRLEEISNVKS
jgi:oligopeptide/dipeptide ABC transporter ATP-binding protein